MDIRQQSSPSSPHGPQTPQPIYFDEGTKKATASSSSYPQLVPQVSGQSQSQSAETEQQNIANVTTYNLTKRKSLYNEMINEYAQIGKYRLGSNNSYISIYSYRPALYALVATLYHLKVKKFPLIWICMHAGAILAINQYDLNNGAKNTFQAKWEEYEEATKNYELALSLIKVPFWAEAKKYTLDKLSVENYLKILENRPH